MAETIDAVPLLDGVATGRVDWSDAARVPTRLSGDGLTLARACFEQAPGAVRWFLVVGWFLLLLEGGPRSDGSHVMGWPVEERGATAVCRRRSRLGIDAVLVFTCRSGDVVFASAMSFSNPAARLLWAAVAPVHRWAVRYVLADAARTLSTSSPVE